MQMHVTKQNSQKNTFDFKYCENKQSKTNMMCAHKAKTLANQIVIFFQKTLQKCFKPVLINKAYMVDTLIMYVDSIKCTLALDTLIFAYYFKTILSNLKKYKTTQILITKEASNDNCI